MDHSAPDLPATQRLKMIGLVVAGMMIPLMLDALLDLATMHPRAGHGGWPAYATRIGMLAGGATTMVIAYRMARYSRRPSAALILLLMAMVVATVAVSHFS